MDGNFRFGRIVEQILSHGEHDTGFRQSFLNAALRLSMSFLRREPRQRPPGTYPDFDAVMHHI
jgi:hypothetical protein